jgi:hypothetical protein
MVEHLSAMKRLGSRFFFQRQKAHIMTSSALWRTVAYDLARRHSIVRKAIVARLKEGDPSITTVDIDKLFLRLIHGPLSESESNSEELPPVVVIDAVDECGGLEGQYSEDRKTLMRTFASWSGLPAKFKLIVTSRREIDIEELFSTTRHFPIEVSAGQVVEAQSSEDIRLFLTYRLHEAALGCSESLSPTWPGPQVIHELTKRAGGLFIWAETITRFIRSGDPEGRLGLVLEEAGTSYLDTLYEQILNTSFPNPTASESMTLCSVLGTIILAKASLSRLAIAHLLSLKVSTVERICTGLRSLVRSGETLGFYHESFVDFLLNPSRSPSKFFVMRQRESKTLTQACLRTIKENTRFNIRDLESSHTLNADIPDLLSREKENIPQHLAYSYSWWASHLVETEGMFQDLAKFMQRLFLFYLSLATTDQHALLANVGGRVRDAVAAAIIHEEYEIAVVWAEEGRSIAWQNLLGLYGRIDDLRRAHPQLADRLQSIAQRLGSSGCHDLLRNEGQLEDVFCRYSKLFIEWDNLIDEIRRIPNFEGFLRPKSFSELAPAIHEGPVVILNASDLQCDALVLIADDSPEMEVSVVNIPLERFSNETSKMLFQALTEILSSAGVRERNDRKTGRAQSQADGEAKFKKILHILWQGVVKPVIEGLAFQVRLPVCSVSVSFFLNRLNQNVLPVSGGAQLGCLHFCPFMRQDCTTHKK